MQKKISKEKKQGAEHLLCVCGKKIICTCSAGSGGSWSHTRFGFLKSFRKWPVTDVRIRHFSLSENLLLTVCHFLFRRKTAWCSTWHVIVETNSTSFKSRFITYHVILSKSFHFSSLGFYSFQLGIRPTWQNYCDFWDNICSFNKYFYLAPTVCKALLQH